MPIKLAGLDYQTGPLPLFAITVSIPICVRIAIVNTLQLLPCRRERLAGSRPGSGSGVASVLKTQVGVVLRRHLEMVTTGLPVRGARIAAIGSEPDRGRR